jgi:hypothetical protein
MGRIAKFAVIFSQRGELRWLPGSNLKEFLLLIVIVARENHHLFLIIQ